MEVLNYHEIEGNKLTEADIIRRILDGEKELYEILVRRNNQKLYRVVRSYLKNESEVEDIMQNAYLKAYEKLFQFKLNASFSTWLIRIGINESLGHLKSRRKIYDMTRQPDDNHTIPILELPDAGQPNPQRKMIRKETKKLLEDAIDQLDLKYRTVYILKEIEELSVKEVALLLDLSESNIKVRLHRARAILKEILFELSSDKDVFEFAFGRCDRITERVMKNL